jgi:hypothetical protein
MKNVLVVLLVLLLASVCWGKKKDLTKAKVEVVEESQSFKGAYGPSGPVGALRGRHVFDNALDMKTLINGDHALLRCYENHQGCNILGPGTYDAEIKISKNQDSGGDAGKGNGPDVWIFYVQPLDHKVFREHWKVSGTW